MAGRIVNHLTPEVEGALYGTVAEAEAALGIMIKDFKATGYTVTETNDNADGEVWHGVVDEDGNVECRWNLICRILTSE
jgi:hypothetical protein